MHLVSTIEKLIQFVPSFQVTTPYNNTLIVGFSYKIKFINKRTNISMLQLFALVSIHSEHRQVFSHIFTTIPTALQHSALQLQEAI